MGVAFICFAYFPGRGLYIALTARKDNPYRNSRASIVLVIIPFHKYGKPLEIIIFNGIIKSSQACSLFQGIIV